MLNLSIALLGCVTTMMLIFAFVGVWGAESISKHTKIWMCSVIVVVIAGVWIVTSGRLME